MLKKAVARALQKCKAREALPLFIADLEAKDALVRDSAYYYFRQFFVDSPPPFDPKASEKVRKLQIAKIKIWFSKQSA